MNKKRAIITFATVAWLMAAVLVFISFSGTDSELLAAQEERTLLATEAVNSVDPTIIRQRNDSTQAVRDYVLSLPHIPVDTTLTTATVNEETTLPSATELFRAGISGATDNVATVKGGVSSLCVLIADALIPASLFIDAPSVERAVTCDNVVPLAEHTFSEDDTLAFSESSTFNFDADSDVALFPKAEEVIVRQFFRIEFTHFSSCSVLIALLDYLTSFNGKQPQRFPPFMALRQPPQVTGCEVNSEALNVFIQQGLGVEFVENPPLVGEEEVVVVNDAVVGVLPASLELEFDLIYRPYVTDIQEWVTVANTGGSLPFLVELVLSVDKNPLPPERLGNGFGIALDATAFNATALSRLFHLSEYSETHALTEPTLWDAFAAGDTPEVPLESVEIFSTLR